MPKFCDVCRTVQVGGLLTKFSVCDQCKEKWKNGMINMILTDLCSGSPTLQSYRCICKNRIYTTSERFCEVCGTQNLFMDIKRKLNTEILKKVFNNTLTYKRISRNITKRILWLIFGLEYKTEGAYDQIRIAMDPDTAEIILTRNCNWQLLSSLFEFYYPHIIPRNEDNGFNRKIEKHIKEIYHLSRVTNEDIRRVVSEYENINPRIILINKHGAKTQVKNGTDLITEDYGNKNLILKYLRRKMWDCATDWKDRKSYHEENENKEEKDMKKTEQREKLPIKEAKDEVYKDQEGNIHIHVSGKKNVYVHGPVEVFKYNSKPTKPQVENYPAFLDNIQEDTSPSEIIAMARKEMGITQKELAKRIGVATKTITSYENDICNVKKSRARKLGEILNIPHEFLTV